jgi:hypothetical protein
MQQYSILHHNNTISTLDNHPHLKLFQIQFIIIGANFVVVVIAILRFPLQHLVKLLQLTGFLFQILYFGLICAPQTCRSYTQ